MSKGLLITEAMSGWIKLENDQQRDFSFTITAFTPNIFSLTAKRAFKGVATISGLGNFNIEGMLIIRPMGPEYSFNMTLPEIGRLEGYGRKSYSLPKLIYSMTHCPLKISKAENEIGSALLAYRDSILVFPFKALSLVQTPKWYDTVSEPCA